MPTLHFTGRVVPERADVTLRLGPLQIEHGATGMRGIWHISIVSSQLAVTTQLDADPVDLATLRNVVQDTVASLVDCLGYSWGYAYDVEVSAVTDETGGHIVFGVGFPPIAEARDERPLSPEETLQIALQSPWLRRALGELRRALRYPGDSGFHSYRAVEAVRQHFVALGSEEDRGWPALREALNVSRGSLEPLQTYAEAQRHGEYPYVSGADREDLMEIAWRVVDRFIVLLHRGLDAVPSEEFPPL
jgi:hypothetical protein